VATASDAVHALLRDVKAVLFDFDGVIADTETCHFDTFRAVLADAGVELDASDDGSRFLGVHDRAAFEIAFAAAGRRLDRATREELVARKSALYASSASEIALFPGAREAIAGAARRGPMTIASGGRRCDIGVVLAAHGLIDAFPSFVSGDETERPKPDPECFLRALALLRRERAPALQPGECLVIEDSFRGVEAARAAGMRTIAVTHSSTAAQLAGADLVVDGLAGCGLAEPSLSD